MEELVILNIGGMKYFMYKSVIHKYSDSFLSIFFTNELTKPNYSDKDHPDQYFFMRNGKLFEPIYDFYVTGKIDLTQKEIKREFKFWFPQKPDERKTKLRNIAQLILKNHKSGNLYLLNLKFKESYEIKSENKQVIDLLRLITKKNYYYNVSKEEIEKDFLEHIYTIFGMIEELKINSKMIQSKDDIDYICHYLNKKSNNKCSWNEVYIGSNSYDIAPFLYYPTYSKYTYRYEYHNDQIFEPNYAYKISFESKKINYEYMEDLTINKETNMETGINKLCHKLDNLHELLDSYFFRRRD